MDQFNVFLHLQAPPFPSFNWSVCLSIHHSSLCVLSLELVGCRAVPPNVILAQNGVRDYVRSFESLDLNLRTLFHGPSTRKDQLPIWERIPFHPSPLNPRQKFVHYPVVMAWL